VPAEKTTPVASTMPARERRRLAHL
jgi:hypothetical protein